MLGGDLRDLTPPQKMSYYRAVCDSIGLNPLTKPFEFITLSGRLVLYATRNATDQLRKMLRDQRDDHGPRSARGHLRRHGAGDDAERAL